jgi:hypothetical protein
MVAKPLLSLLVKSIQPLQPPTQSWKPWEKRFSNLWDLQTFILFFEFEYSSWKLVYPLHPSPKQKDQKYCDKPYVLIIWLNLTMIYRSKIKWFSHLFCSLMFSFKFAQMCSNSFKFLFKFIPIFQFFRSSFFFLIYFLFSFKCSFCQLPFSGTFGAWGLIFLTVSTTLFPTPKA